MIRRFFASPNMIVDGRVVLDTAETRHLRDVLRLSAGDEVALFDGAGNEYSARIGEISKRSTVIEITERIESRFPESKLDLTIAAAMLKSDKFDLVVQKCVELGVRRLVPLATNRTDVKPKAALPRVERWRKIAIEASKQCGRSVVMEIADPFEFAAFCKSDESETKIFFSERGGVSFDRLSGEGRMTAVVGPEGGWDDVEIELARSGEFLIVTLGGRILRAETASIALATILQHRFGDLN